MRIEGFVGIGTTMVLAACIEGPPPAIGIAKHLEGSYRFAYTAPDGSVIDEARDDIVFMSRETSPQCCFGVSLNQTTLTLYVGNHYEVAPIPTDGICPTVASAVVQVTGIPEHADDVEIPLDTSNARLYVFTKAPTTGLCARSTNYQDAGATSREATVSGQLKLDDLHCLVPDTPGCGLVGRGSWAFQGVDGAGSVVVSANGDFVSSDTAGPITF